MKYLHPGAGGPCDALRINNLYNSNSHSTISPPLNFFFFINKTMPFAELYMHISVRTNHLRVPKSS